MSCPNCGYCRHCGRSDNPFGPGRMAPYYPMPYQPTVPVWPAPYWTTTGGTLADWNSALGQLQANQKG